MNSQCKRNTITSAAFGLFRGLAGLIQTNTNDPPQELHRPQAAAENRGKEAGPRAAIQWLGM